MNYYQLVEQITKYNEEQKKHNVYYAIYGEEGMAKKPKLKEIVDKAIGLIEIPAPPPQKRRKHNNRQNQNNFGRRSRYYYNHRKNHNRPDNFSDPIKLNLEIEVDVKEKRRGHH